MKRVQYGISAFVLVIATMVGNVAFSNQASALAGEGDDNNPWLITSCVDLQELNSSASYNNDSFVLTQNINCNGVNFTRLMFATDQEFKGTFDGAGYKISNIAVNNSVDSENGFFGRLDGAIIKDLTLENVTVSGEARVGALAGRSVGASYIENVNVIGGTVTGVSDSMEEFGGLIGSIEETQLFNVIVDVDVVASTAYYVGGLVGYVTGSTLGQVAALGNVEGNEGVGGLVGYAGNVSEFDKSFATGNVIAHAGPGGGLVGQAYDTNFIGTYARGNVTGSGYLGGHTGLLGAGSLIGWAYATGAVTIEGESIGGGLVGYADESATVQGDSFWDVQTTGMETSGGTGEVGKTTAEMKNMETYIPFDWNFEDYWFQGDSVNDGYLCQIWYQVCYDAFTGGNAGGGSALPNNGDGNNDGTIDEDQDNVVTLLSPVSKKYVTVAVDDSCVLSDISIANASSHASQDTGFKYTSGFVNFTATGCDQDVANVKLYYHGVTPENVIARKYNPITNTYFTIAGASITAAPAPLSGTVVSYAVADNSELDIDPTDGVIVDPVGLANVPGVPNTGIERASVLPVIAMLSAGIVTLAVLVLFVRKKTI